MKNLYCHFFLAFLCCAMLLFSSCQQDPPNRKRATKGSLKPNAPTLTRNNNLAANASFSREMPSVVQVPVKLAMADMNRQINAELPNGTLIHADKTFKKQSGISYKLKLWKADNIQLQAKNNYIYAKLPVKVKVNAKHGLSFLGSKPIETEATLEINARSQISVNSDWKLLSKTELLKHRWLSNPEVKIAGFGLDVKAMADVAIQNIVPRMMPQVDQAIREKVDLKKPMQKAWKALQEPYQIANDPNIWLHMQPETVSLATLRAENDSLQLTVGLNMKSKTLFERPSMSTLAANLQPLPALKRKKTLNNTFAVNLAVDLPYEKATELAIKKLVGYEHEFMDGRYAVEVADIELYPSGELLVAKVAIDGSVDGTVYLTGKPIYDPKQQLLYIDTFDFDIETQNMLFKAASWLAHKSFIESIRSKLRFPIQEQLSNAQSDLETALAQKKIGDYALLNVDFQEVVPKNVALTASGLKAIVLAKGKANVVLTANETASIFGKKTLRLPKRKSGIRGSIRNN